MMVDPAFLLLMLQRGQKPYPPPGSPIPPHYDVHSLNSTETQNNEFTLYFPKKGKADEGGKQACGYDGGGANRPISWLLSYNKQTNT